MARFSVGAFAAQVSLFVVFVLSFKDTQLLRRVTLHSAAAAPSGVTATDCV
jgi:hypothetical protein